MDRVVQRLRPALKQEAKTLGELLALSGMRDEDHFIRVLSWMRDAGMIKVDRNGKYHWA
jgi:predicted transcriptional regulator